MTVNAVRIDTATKADVPALLEIFNVSALGSHAIFDVRQSTLEERLVWLGRYAPSGPHQLLVARDGDGDVLGYASSSRYRDHEAFDRTVEFSISLRADTRGRGVGSALYTELLDRLRPEPVHVAVVGIALPNDASLALHRKFGFEEIGTFREYAVKNGRYYSSCWLQRFLGD